VNSFQSVPAFLSVYKALFVTRPPAKVYKNDTARLSSNADTYSKLRHFNLADHSFFEVLPAQAGNKLPELFENLVIPQI
jgi:hypothetical protein